jgi:hypothetical protein
MYLPWPSLNLFHTLNLSYLRSFVFSFAVLLHIELKFPNFCFGALSKKQAPIQVSLLVRVWQHETF